MFNRVVSGCVDPEEPAEDQDAVYRQAMTGYHGFLRGRDLSNAGDLLLFFGYDFFHDAGIRSLELVSTGRDVKLELEAWLEYDTDVEDLPDSLVFDAVFRDTVLSEIRREVDDSWGLDSFKYGEIDGLDDKIAAVVDNFGGEFHSLTVECDNGWIALVFRSVQVIPQDPILWARVMRDQHSVLPLWGVDREAPA